MFKDLCFMKLNRSLCNFHFFNCIQNLNLHNKFSVCSSKQLLKIFITKFSTYVMINIENFQTFQIIENFFRLKYVGKQQQSVTDVTNLAEKHTKYNSTGLFPRYIGGSRTRSFVLSRLGIRRERK